MSAAPRIRPRPRPVAVVAALAVAVLAGAALAGGARAQEWGDGKPVPRGGPTKPPAPAPAPVEKKGASSADLSPQPADRLIAEGHDHMRLGNYFRASEVYRCAVMEAERDGVHAEDGLKRLCFGHALFGLGQYAYSAFQLRRGVRYVGFPDDLEVDIVRFFPSMSAFERQLADARRYAGYFPADPHALTVIAYATYFAGDLASAEDAARRLRAKDERDAFAAYILRRVDLDRKGGGRPAPRDLAAAPKPPAKPAPTPTPAPPPVATSQAPPAPPRAAPPTAAPPLAASAAAGEGRAPESSTLSRGETLPGIAR